MYGEWKESERNEQERANMRDANKGELGQGTRLGRKPQGQKADKGFSTFGGANVTAGRKGRMPV